MNHSTGRSIGTRTLAKSTYRMERKTANRCSSTCRKEEGSDAIHIHQTSALLKNNYRYYVRKYETLRPREVSYTFLRPKFKYNWLVSASGY